MQVICVNLPDPRSIKSSFEFNVPNLSFPKIKPQATSHKCGGGDGAIWCKSYVVAVVKNIFGSGENLQIFPNTKRGRCVDGYVRAEEERI